MGLNKVYRRHLLKSVLIVLAGMAIIFKGIYPEMSVADNFFVLVMSIICAFLAFFGGLILFIRIGKAKFRRKFMYSFSAVANFFVGGISLSLHYKTAGELSLLIYAVSILLGLLMLADVLFGKRSPKKHEHEMLIE